MLAHDYAGMNGQICRMPPRPPRPSHITHYLREHREAAGLKQPQVAEMMNRIIGEPKFTANDISRFERGRRGVSPDNLRIFAEIYGVDVARLHEPPRTRDLNRLLEGQPDEMWTRAERLLQALVEPPEPK